MTRPNEAVSDECGISRDMITLELIQSVVKSPQY